MAATAESVAAASLSKTEEIVAYLLTPEGRAQTNAQIARIYGVHEGTVARARQKILGPNGGLLVDLPIAAIVAGDQFQLRAIEGGLDKDAVDDYAAAYKAGKALPPLQVVAIDGEYHVVTLHRYAAARKAGLLTVNCEAHEGDLKFAYCLAARSNASNGLRFGKADRRKAVETLLAKFPEMADLGPREFERETGIPESTYRKIKNELAQAKAAEREPFLPAEVSGAEAVTDCSVLTEGFETETETEPETEEDDDPAPAPPSIKVPTPKAKAEDPEPEPDEDEAPEVVFNRQRHKILEKLPRADIEHLLRCPTFLDLDGDRLRCFVEEHLYRKAMAEALADFKKAHNQHKPTGRLRPRLATFVEALLKARDVTRMSTCAECAGKGCKNCHNLGYN